MKLTVSDQTINNLKLTQLKESDRAGFNRLMKVSLTQKSFLNLRFKVQANISLYHQK